MVTATPRPELTLPLRSDDLLMRALTMDDVTVHHRLFGDPLVVRYLYEEPLTLDQARDHLAGRLPARLPGDGEWLNLAVEHAGRYLGEVGVGVTSLENRHCSVGYVFLPEACGRGRATRAARAMVDLAFTHLDAHRVSARMDARNEASARMALRLGMSFEGIYRENEWVKGEWTDEAVYSILHAEWESARWESARWESAESAGTLARVPRATPPRPH